MPANTPPGPAVDASGQAVIDPTDNVMALVAAAVQRQDDLREMTARHMKELLAEREERYAHREQYVNELRHAEAARIDAIRAVDVAAVATATAAADARAAALASQVALSAEAVRVNLAAALEPIQKDIADLRRAQYEAQGQKTQVVEGRQSTAAVYALVGLIIAVVLATVTVVGVVITNTP